MADFTPKKIEDISQLNGGKEYINGVDIPNADDWNNVIESQLWTQKLAENPVDNSEANQVGEAQITIETLPDGTPCLKPKNLLGKQGVGVSSINITYRATDSGTDVPAEIVSPDIPTVKQGQWLWSKIVYNLTNGQSVEGYINSRNPYDALIYKPFFFDGAVTGDTEFQLADFNRNVVVGDRFIIYQYNSAASTERQGTLYLMQIARILNTVCFAGRVGDGKPVAPIITATVTVDGTFSETPTSTVTNNGSPLNPNFHFDFTGLRGKAGKDGTQISQIVDGQPYTAGSYTITPVTVSYTDNSKTPTQFNVYAKQGETGSGGFPATVKSYNISYQSSTDGTQIPTGQWVSAPAPIKGQYLWTRTEIIFTTSPSIPVYVFAVAYVGEDGQTPNVSGYLPLTGGTLSGNLTVGSASIQTNGYIKSTWLYTSGATQQSASATKVAIIHSDGYIYWRSPAQIIADAGRAKAMDIIFQTSSLTEAGIKQFTASIDNYDVLYFCAFRNSDGVYGVFAIPVVEWKRYRTDGYKYEITPSASADVWITLSPNNKSSDTTFDTTHFQVVGVSKATLKYVYGVKY